MVAVGGIASFVLSDDHVEVWGFFPAFSIWHWCSSTREVVIPMKEHAFQYTSLLLLGYNPLSAYHIIAISKTFRRFQILCVHFIHSVQLGLWAKSPCSLTLDLPKVSTLGI